MVEESLATRRTLQAIDARKAVSDAVREVQTPIPLKDALLCLSCEVIYAGAACPKCGDRFGWLLQRWLSAAAA